MSRIHPASLPLLSLAMVFFLAADTSALDATDIVPTRVDIAVRTDNGVPIGSIVAWPVGSDGFDTDAWLECQGQTVSATLYPQLVLALTGSSSAASATLPDLRGLFLRGYGAQVIEQNNGTRNGITATTHSSGELMTPQGDSLRPLYGNLPAGGSPIGGEDLNLNLSGVFSWTGSGTAAGQGTGTRSNAQAFFDASLYAPVDNEVRPASMAVRYLIRAR